MKRADGFFPLTRLENRYRLALVLIFFVASTRPAAFGFEYGYVETHTAPRRSESYRLTREQAIPCEDRTIGVFVYETYFPLYGSG